MELHEKIQLLRKKNNLSQEALAEKLGISRQSVSKWESNLSTPEIEKILEISNIFSVSTDYLLKTDILSTDNISSAHSITDDKKARKVKFIGLIMSCLGIIGALLFWILSIIHPATVHQNHMVYSGLRGFLIYHNAMYLFSFSCMIGIIGIFIWLWNEIRKIVICFLRSPVRIKVGVFLLLSSISAIIFTVIIPIQNEYSSANIQCSVGVGPLVKIVFIIMGLLGVSMFFINRIKKHRK